LSSIYSSWIRKKRRARKVIGGGFVGVLIGAAVGYPFGFFIVPLLGYQNEAFKDAYAAGPLFAEICIVIGIFIGGRIGDLRYRKIRRAEFKVAREERLGGDVTAWGTARRTDEELNAEYAEDH
jgi:MFS family permease